MDEQQEHEAIGKCRYTMVSNGTYTAVAYRVQRKEKVPDVMCRSVLLLGC